MTYSPRARAKAQARRKARDAKLKRVKPVADAAQAGPRSRAGNAPNVASLLASVRNPKRREVLRFVGAVARSSLGRRTLLKALSVLDTEEGKALRSKIQIPEPAPLPEVAP